MNEFKHLGSTTCENGDKELSYIIKEECVMKVRVQVVLPMEKQVCLLLAELRHSSRSVILFLKQVLYTKEKSGGV